MTAPDLRAAVRAVVEWLSNPRPDEPVYIPATLESLLVDLRDALADAEREDALDRETLRAAEVEERRHSIQRGGPPGHRTVSGLCDCRLCTATRARRAARGEASPQP